MVIDGSFAYQFARTLSKVIAIFCLYHLLGPNNSNTIVSEHWWVPCGSLGQDVGGYLGILKHAEVSVHVEREVLMPAPLVQFGGLMELPLVGKHICQKQVIVGLSPLLPLLEKLEAQETAYAAIAGSSLYKG